MEHGLGKTIGFGVPAGPSSSVSTSAFGRAATYYQWSKVLLLSWWRHVVRLSLGVEPKVVDGIDMWNNSF
jgi:hypothetical protein